MALLGRRIVRIVLVRASRRQQPNRGAKLGLHVRDALPRSHELRQQVPQAAGPLDRPHPRRLLRGPLHQPCGVRSRIASGWAPGRRMTAPADIGTPVQPEAMGAAWRDTRAFLLKRYFST